MACPRPGEKCYEFMCGSSIDGICGGPDEPHEPTAKEFYDLLCNPITINAIANSQSVAQIHKILEYQLNQLEGKE